MFYNEAKERMTIDHLRSVQSELLQQMVRHQYRKIKFLQSQV